MHLMLIIEKNVFNILMYVILLIGGLAAIIVDLLGTLVGQEVYWHSLRIITGVMAAGALCHYFHHRSAAYLAQDEDKGSEFIAYENDLKDHRYNNLVVVTMNFIILGILTWEFIRSYLKVFTLTRASEYGPPHYFIAFFAVSLIVFVMAPIFGKEGWKGKGGFVG